MPHINAFMELFSGRKDCYGMNQICMKEPLTKEIYKGHLDGIKRIGVYPIFDTNKTSWAACDIDEENFDKALGIKNLAAENDIPMHIERSKSKGYHIWVFLDKSIEAVKIRLVLELFLSQLDIKCEIFPKQDEVNDGQYGNFIFLPFFGGDTVNNRTVFVDDINLPDITDYKDINKLKKVNIEKINSVINKNKLFRRDFSSPVENVSETTKGYSKSLPCIENIRKGVKKGNRNEACFRLTIYLKERGNSKE